MTWFTWHTPHGEIEFWFRGSQTFLVIDDGTGLDIYEYERETNDALL